MSQYALSLNLPAIYSADNFFVSACNREAYAWIERWPDWPQNAKSLILHGPSGSGKTHLSHLWAAKAQAKTLQTEPDGGNLLIEDIEKAKDPRQLLHAYNYTKEQGGSLLLTSAVPPPLLPFTLPDLTSRLLALPTAELHQPDDEVIAGAIRKQFADRQMKVDDDVIAYILPRMERSLASAKQLVESLDQKALAESRSITIPFVKRLLDR